MLELVSAMGQIVDGLDVASAGELAIAIQAHDHVSFAGPGKRDRELEAAIRAGATLNLESEGEATRALRISQQLGVTPKLAVRVNPDFDLKGSGMRMGGGAKPFGIDAERVPALVRHLIAEGADWRGFHIFAGSQALDGAAIAETQRQTVALAAQLADDAGAVPALVNLGGGLGIPYRQDNSPPPLPDAYADIVKKHMTKLGLKVIFEPGRLIVGNAGVLVTSVIYVKDGDHKNFVIVDAAMNDLIRPTLYEAWHDIVPVKAPAADDARISADIVGPVCETGDYLGLGREMPRPNPGDLLVVRTAGAYGAVQSGTYNTRALVPEVLVKGDKFHVIRPRLDLEALIALDSVPEWLA